MPAEEAAVESIDLMSTVRFAGSTVPGPGQWVWPWGQPYTPYSTPNWFAALPFSAKTSTTTLAYPGPNRIFLWPQILGKTRTVHWLSIPRRSSSGTSDDHMVALGIYDDSLVALWRAVNWIYPATVGLGQTNDRQVYYQPNVELEAGRVYWLAMMYKPTLVTNNVVTHGFHASLLQPLLGVKQYIATSQNGEYQESSTFQALSPQPAFGYGYAFFDSSTNAIPVPDPWVLPKAINVITPWGSGLEFDSAQTLSLPGGGTTQSALVPFPTASNIPGWNPALAADEGLRTVLQATGGGTANVPAIWTALGAYE